MSLKDNINKTRRYMRKNGLKKAVFAVAERLTSPSYKEYGYVPSTEAELDRQRKIYKTMTYKPLISLLVPAYNTKEKYLTELVESVQAQTYENWELIITDASTENSVEETIKKIDDKRIVYRRLDKNQGISGNTNEALAMAKGDYIGLLDHDDLLTPECLFYVSRALEKDNNLEFIYTDEDKTDSNASKFYDPNKKKDFNLELFLSNNYICHFACIRADIIKGLKLRGEYDGAQDFDLFLRVIKEVPQERILHISKILYHWRCHEDSTAVNTDSKAYAYEAGLRAVKDYCDTKGWDVTVSHTDHLGFYRIDHKVDIFIDRPEIGAVGGPVIKAGRVVAGAIKADGKYMYTGQPVQYSGYLHRAKLQQRVHGSDIRNMRVCPGLEDVYEEYMNRLKNKEDINTLNLEFAQKVHEMGLIILYDPELRTANM